MAPTPQDGAQAAGIARAGRGSAASAKERGHLACGRRLRISEYCFLRFLWV